MVPVHYYDVDVFPFQQQRCDVVQPHGWRSRGPITMNDEGGRSGQIELGMARQVGVGQECTTGALFPGVQQQPNFDAGAKECMTNI